MKSLIDLEFVEGAAHAAFFDPLFVDTKNFVYGTIGWPLGGSLEWQKEMMSKIIKFIKARDK